MKKIKNILLKVILLIITLYLIFLQPLPLYIESPGEAFNLNEMIEVDNRASREVNQLYLTTIGIQQATLFTSLSSVLPFRDLVKEEDLFGEIEDIDQYNKVQKIYMENSIHNAVQVAFNEAGKDYEMNFKGIYVMQVADVSSFSDVLRVGDVIKSIDGHYFKSSVEFIDYIQEKNENESISLEYERNGMTKRVEGKTILLDSQKVGIGIGLTDYTIIETNPDVKIYAGDIGGPSAGLMFALQVYNQLQEENNFQTYEIAGTGTIDEDGSVGRIGGAAKKVVAADKKNIEYFFVPDDEITEEMTIIDPLVKSNYEEALEAAEAISSDMEIIPIKNIKEAIQFLEELNSDHSTTKNEVNSNENDVFRLGNVARIDI